MLEMYGTLVFLLICLGFLLAGLLVGSGAITPTFLLLAVSAGLLLALSTSILFARLVVKNKNGGSLTNTSADDPNKKEEVHIYDFHSIPESLFNTINDHVEQINPTELFLTHVYPNGARISTESARSAAHQTFSSRLQQRMDGFNTTAFYPTPGELFFWLYNSRGHLRVLRVGIYQSCVELTVSAAPARTPIIIDIPNIRDSDHFNELFADLANDLVTAVPSVPTIASNRPPPEVLTAPAA
jgi:hypothetical protein